MAGVLLFLLRYTFSDVQLIYCQGLSILHLHVRHSGETTSYLSLPQHFHWSSAPYSARRKLLKPMNNISFKLIIDKSMGSSNRKLPDRVR